MSFITQTTQYFTRPLTHCNLDQVILQSRGDVGWLNESSGAQFSQPDGKTACIESCAARCVCNP